ncbi:MAG: hypothetical protein UR69_C0002G0168 [Candidatus Moranbacteria bacterium GW2011_GWE2_35_2-]|nr:MAG: hypothetical protein UR69_C0002G0168 [Candidatus Moranbacteria bacterium GW2011_GWE2_35_2-]KKQ06769.1 MAG: hypothetical protein US15_C0004G0016 [Candidatus Moranbacteria bacterium GW2011_GWF1_36_4]KKQ22483.1 MAG: hypothetical protein US37_C0002G0108 [Candidatus Moranbacteria bacterium GW2011_GWF2_37_11]KKQ29552.1 MAG: hypothetical protein US44_C0001G0144 [Candidatus Moranbacteria bacterium GW2011_GWD1_37_17]KKQ30578.1 MAG: hypothetical protein US47_C0002G0168 [Candidatus Moranbacteria b
MATNTNQIIDDFLKKTLWVWLPFVALYRLMKELVEKIGKFLK